MPAQFARKSQRNAHQRRMRQRFSYREVRPATSKPIDCRWPRDVDSVPIGLIDFGESLNQISRVGFVAGELSSNGMRVNSDVHDISIRTWSGSDGILESNVVN